MDTQTKLNIGYGIAVFVLIGLFFVGGDNGRGSVVDSGTYTYKNITSSNASATVPVVVKNQSGTLGSIVVNTTHATVIRIYDATTATSTGATLVASLPTSAVVGTYTFDVAVKNGIVLDVPAGFAGNYTVTYR